MRKKLRKIIATSLFMVFLIPQSVLAYSPMDTSEIVKLENVQTTISNVAVRNATDEEQKLVEEGKILPIEVDDIDALLDSIKTGTFDLSNSFNVQETPLYSPMGESDIAKKGVLSISGVDLYPAYINCQFTYSSYVGDGYYRFNSIGNIRSWATGMNIPLNFTWTQTSSSYSLYNQDRNVTIYVGGYVAVSVLVKGVLQIVTYNQSYDFEFTARA